MATNIIKGYIPGAIGRIVELHGIYYHQRAGFGLHFEGTVASELSAFLQRYDDGRDGLWLALHDGRIEGAIAIDGLHAHEAGAQLRWFIASDRLRGSGMGNEMLVDAIAFCRACGYARVQLSTFEGLQAARHLYERHGFQLTRQCRATRWGAEVNEQCFELSLPV